MSRHIRMLLVALFDHQMNRIFSLHIVNGQFLSPGCGLLQDLLVVSPIVLFLHLVFPSDFELELSSKPSGVDKTVNDPKFLILYLYDRLGFWNSTHNLILFGAG